MLLRTRSGQFALLVLTAIAAAFARFAISPLQEALRVALSLSDNQMSLLQGAALALPMAVAAIPLGLLIDRYSRVRLLVLFAVLDLIGSVLTAFATSFAVLFIARSMVGLAVAAIGTTAFSLLADLYPPAQRGRASMMVLIGQYAGMSAAFAVGGALLSMFGASAASLQRAQLWMALPLVAVIISTLAMREPPRMDREIANPSPRQSLLELWRYRAVVAPLLVGLVMAEMAVLGVLTWASPALARSFELAPERIGAIMAVALFLSGVVGPIAGGALADVCQRIGGPRLTMFSLSLLALLCAPAALFPVMPTVSSASVLLVTFMTFVGAILVVGIALFTIVIPNELRGLCVAALAGVQVVFGVALAPVTVSVLSNAMGGGAMVGTALAIVGSATSLLGAACFLFGRRYFSGAMKLEVVRV